jgi:predicted DNA-binding transcriptional regulator YafY
VVPIHRAGPSIDPALLTSLAGACRDQEQLAFRYADWQSTASQRQVEPHGLVHAGSRWYLVAWDLARRALPGVRLPESLVSALRSARKSGVR